MALCPVCDTPSAKPLILKYGWCDACNKYRKLAEYFVEQAVKHPLWDPDEPEECLRILMEDKKFTAKVNNTQRARAREPAQARVVAARPKFRSILLRRLLVVAERLKNGEPFSSATPSRTRTPPTKRKYETRRRRLKLRQIKHDDEYDEGEDYGHESDDSQSPSPPSSPDSFVCRDMSSDYSPRPRERAPLAMIDDNISLKPYSTRSNSTATVGLPAPAPPTMAPPAPAMEYDDFPELAEYCDDIPDAMMMLEDNAWWQEQKPLFGSAEGNGLPYLTQPWQSGSDDVVPMATD